MRKPNTALTIAARNAAPKLKRYAASVRGAVTVSAKSCQDRLAVLSASMESGMSTIRPSQKSAYPIDRRKPGIVLRFLGALMAGSGSVDLVEHAFVGEMRLLRLLPPAELLDGDEPRVPELVLILRGHLGEARAIVMLRRDLLPLGCIKVF